VPPHQTAPRPPRRLRALLIGCVIAAGLGVLLFVGLGSAPKSGSGSVVAAGSIAPDFTLPSLTGGSPVRLDRLGRDRHRPVVLNFFASWCTPCQMETPLLASTARAEQARGSTVQFVGVDVADPTAAALAFVRQSGIGYPVGVDANVRVTSALYGLDGQPNTFFIDASGRVLGHTIGQVTAAQLHGWLSRLGSPA
jgi:cytochrome c biogenesis protein CcmG/thiol:disulfide interchange protein DsbE